jgi:hypothetical protein
MHKNKRSSLLLVLILIILVSIPLTVWLILNTTQLLDRRAADDEVTITLVPTSVETALGEEYDVDIYLNSGAIKVSAATVTLDVEPNTTRLTNLEFITSADKPYDEVIYNANEDPYTFTVLAKRTDETLPLGSFKIATATFQATGPGTTTIAFDTSQSEIVGVKADSDKITFGVVSAESLVSVAGQLCRIEACTQANTISLVEQPRNDLKYNVHISWEPPVVSGVVDSPLYFYKIYRSVGSPVTEPHETSKQIASSLDTSLIDNNTGLGYEGSQQIYYDIDTYIVCPGSGSANPTPTTGLVSVTPGNTNQ